MGESKSGFLAKRPFLRWTKSYALARAGQPINFIARAIPFAGAPLGRKNIDPNAGAPIRLIFPAIPARELRGPSN
jgi:hypothetical protein